MTTDLLATSAETWRDRSADPPVIPDALRPPAHGGPRERNRALWQRHDLRRQRAEEVYAASRNPVRGWPVSGNRAVLAFFGDLVREPQALLRAHGGPQRARRRRRARRAAPARGAGQPGRVAGRRASTASAPSR